MEFFLSLEDVFALTSVPMYSNTYAIGIVLNNRDQEKLKFNNAQSNSRASVNKAIYTTWLRNFEKRNRKNNPFKVEGTFPIHRLICFFESTREGLNIYLFILKILLAGGKRLVLASLYRGSLYEKLDEYIQCIVNSLWRYDAMFYVIANFLQMFLW